MTVAPTLRYYAFLGGESGTLLVDGTMANLSLSGVPAGWTNVTSPVKTGARAIRVHVDGSQGDVAGCVAYFSGYTWIHSWHKAITQSGPPVLPYCLAGEIAASRLGLEVGSENGEVGSGSKIRLVRMAASAPYWTNRVALSGWSTDTLATDDSTFKETALWIDGMTLGGYHVWATLFIGDTQQWSLDVGTALSPYSTYFYTCPPVADAAIYLTFDDGVGLRETDITRAPHLVDWPKPTVHRQLAISDVTAQWKKDSSSDPGSYTEWDDDAGPDNETTYNRDITPWSGKRQCGLGQTAATMGISDHTIINGPEVVCGTTAPAILVVHRDENDGSKWAGRFYNSKNPTAGDIIARPGLTYVPTISLYDKNLLLTAWIPGDADSLAFGLEVPYGAEHNITWRATMCMAQWCSYKDVYDHTLFTTPSLPGGVETTPAGGPVFMGLGAGIL